MEGLSYETLQRHGYEGYLLEDAPERVLQFGEGNFMRAFVDYFFDMANQHGGLNGKVALCQMCIRDSIKRGAALTISEAIFAHSTTGISRSWFYNA